MSVGRLFLTEGAVLDWVAAGLALVLLGVLVRLVLRREDRRRPALRLALSGVAVASLLMLAWQPRWLAPPRPRTALLVTSGASPERVASLADSLGGAADVYVLSEALSSVTAKSHWEPVPDVGYLVRRHPEIAALHVVGDGLTDYELEALGSVRVYAHPAARETGIVSVYVSEAPAVGQTMQVQGLVHVAPREETDAPYLFYLEGPGGTADSLDVVERGETAFSLADVPREAGRFLYRLLLLTAARDTLAFESVGVSVRKPSLPRLLVLQGAPRFETRFLRDWLAARRGSMAIRSTISTDRHRAEFVNMPERDLSRLSPALLGAFDLVILDARILTLLDASERRALQDAVEEEGLGVLLGPEVPALASEQARSDRFAFFTFRGRKRDEPGRPGTRLRRETGGLTSPVPVEPFALEPDGDTEPLLYDESGRWVAAMRQRGLGRLAVSLAAETYRWVLEGSADVHAAYWTDILSRVARPAAWSGRWQVVGYGPVFRDEPLALMLQTAEAAPRGLIYSGAGAPDTLFLAQDRMDPARWHGTFWPRRAGWHRVLTLGDDESAPASRWFYVHEASAWQPLRAARKANATRDYARSGAADVPPVERKAEPVRVALPSWWFFLLFLFSSAGLWVESKL